MPPLREPSSILCFTYELSPLCISTMDSRPTKDHSTRRDIWFLYFLLIFPPIKINRVSCRISSVRSSAIRKKNLYHDWVPIFDRNRLMITGSISVKLHSKVRPTLKLVYRQFERKEGERILYSKLSHSFRPFRFYFMGRNLERTWELSCSPTRKVTLARIY